MKKIALFILAALMITGVSFAQEKNEPTGSSDVTKGKSRGEDPNIKVAKRLNSADMETQAIQPVDKGARASRGGSCYVTFDNWTSWYIDCYVDGFYEGYIAPSGSGDITVGGGNTCLYAVAEFDDGDQISWGPKCLNCTNQEFEIETYSDFYNWYLRDR